MYRFRCILLEGGIVKQTPAEGTESSEVPEIWKLSFPWSLEIIVKWILPAALGPGVYWTTNRNEYQKHTNVSEE
jgi:hypothetical protein